MKKIMKLSHYFRAGATMFLPGLCFLATAVQAHQHETVVTAVDPTRFLSAGLVTDITEAACTLSGGTKTTCYKIVVTSVPTDHDVGPWCPRNVTAAAAEGGIWLESGKVHDVDGVFIKNLADFYSDEAFKLYNDDGSVRVTDSAAACAAAARPKVAEEYQNHCVQCLLSYLDEDKVHTFYIPKIPVTQDKPGTVGHSSIGLAFNGVNFDAPAPVDAILGAHTLAPFDDCGGHINLNAGYHYHAHTGCTTAIAQDDKHAPLIGYAMDGYGLYARLNKTGAAADGLDENRGHYDAVRGYHYHVAAAGTNSFISGFKGETGCSADGVLASCDATQNVRRGERRGPPDFAKAANTLGVSETALRDALGRPPDFVAAAEKLGVSLEALKAALSPLPR